MTTREQIRAIHLALYNRITASEMILRELALDIHQALTDAGKDIAGVQAGVDTLIGETK